jgi:serine/threonine protein kinase
MAPEILRKEKYTTKADLFSVGVIMYQLYSRSKLFSASKVREILIKNKDFEI